MVDEDKKNKSDISPGKPSEGTEQKILVPGSSKLTKDLSKNLSTNVVSKKLSHEGHGEDAVPLSKIQSEKLPDKNKDKVKTPVVPENKSADENLEEMSKESSEKEYEKSSKILSEKKRKKNQRSKGTHMLDLKQEPSLCNNFPEIDRNNGEEDDHHIVMTQQPSFDDPEDPDVSTNKKEIKSKEQVLYFSPELNAYYSNPTNEELLAVLQKPKS